MSGRRNRRARGAVGGSTRGRFERATAGWSGTARARVSTTGALTLAGTIALSGAAGGTLTPVGYLSLLATMGGGAAVLLSVGAALRSDARVSGSDSGTGDASADLGATASLSGAATGSGTLSEAELRGDVRGSGSVGSTSSAAADLRGRAGLSGTLLLTGEAGADLEAGSGDLSGSASAVVDASADLRGWADLSGATQGAAEASGTLYAPADLSGALLAGASAGADLRGRADLSGTSEAVSGLSGAFSGGAPLSATVAVAASAGADLRGRADLSGTVGGDATPEADVDAVSDLSGAVSASATAGADLRGWTSLDGSATALGAATADLRGEAALSAEATAIGGAAADLGASADLSGSSTATAATSAALRGVASLSGSSAATAEASADVEVFGFISGTVAATGVTTADLRGRADLSGSASADGGAVADLRGRANLDGASGAIAEALADLRATSGLSGAVSATAAALADLDATSSLSGSSAATASASADLTVTAGGFDFTTIDWTALWDPDDAVDAGSGLASSQPNAAVGGASAGTSADLTFSSGLRPTIDADVAEANDETGLVFSGGEVGFSSTSDWWGFSGNARAFFLIVGMLPTGAPTSQRAVLQVQNYTTVGGLSLRVRLNANGTAALIVENEGGSVSGGDTRTSHPIVADVPQLWVGDILVSSGIGISRFFIQGEADTGPGVTTSMTSGLLANPDRPLCLGGTGPSSGDFTGTVLLGGVYHGTMPWADQAALILGIEERFGTGYLGVIHAPMALHHNTWRDVSSGEITAWKHPYNGYHLLVPPTAGNRPSDSTLAGRPAPYFRGNTELNYLDNTTSGETLEDLVNQGDMEFWIVFQSNNQTSASGTAYYEVPAFISGIDGWFGIGLRNDGAIVAGWNDESSDYEVASATGYDDNDVHVARVWYDAADELLWIQVDADTAVSTSAAAPRIMTDGFNVGTEYSKNNGIEATFHLYGNGGFLSDPDDVYAFLEALYGVTVP